MVCVEEYWMVLNCIGGNWILMDGIELYWMVLNSIGWYGMVWDGMVWPKTVWKDIGGWGGKELVWKDIIVIKDVEVRTIVSESVSESVSEWNCDY